MTGAIARSLMIAHSMLPISTLTGLPSGVLALEDEATNSLIVQDALRASGYLVHAAATAKQALTLLETINFDVAVIDVGLGDGNSFLVADGLPPRSIPFIFCTASGEPGYVK